MFIITFAFFKCAHLWSELGVFITSTLVSLNTKKVKKMWSVVNIRPQLKRLQVTNTLTYFVKV